MAKTKQNNRNIPKAEPAHPEAEAWHEYFRKQREESPQRLEEAAKFLSGMIAITLSIVATTIDKQLTLNPALTRACLLCWLLSLILAFLVVFPLPYKIVKNSAQSIARTHRKTVFFKYIVLALSVSLFMAALVILVIILTGNTGGNVLKDVPRLILSKDTLP